MATTNNMPTQIDTSLLQYNDSIKKKQSENTDLIKIKTLDDYFATNSNMF